MKRSLPHGHHSIGKKRNGVLPTMAGNQVKVGPNWTTVRTVLPSLFPFKGVSWLRLHGGADRTPSMATELMENPVGLDRLLFKQQLDPWFGCEYNDIGFVRMLPRFYCLW